MGRMANSDRENHQPGNVLTNSWLCTVKSWLLTSQVLQQSSFEHTCLPDSLSYQPFRSVASNFLHPLQLRSNFIMSRLSRIFTRLRRIFKRRPRKPTAPRGNPQITRPVNSHTQPNILQVTETPLQFRHRKSATFHPRMHYRSFTVVGIAPTTAPRTAEPQTSDLTQDNKPLIRADTPTAPHVPAPPKLRLRTPTPDRQAGRQRLKVRARKEEELNNESAKRLPNKRGAVFEVFVNAHAKSGQQSWSRSRCLGAKWNTVT